jgi:hypothetical protein
MNLLKYSCNNLALLVLLFALQLRIAAADEPAVF